MRELNLEEAEHLSDIRRTLSRKQPLLKMLHTVLLQEEFPFDANKFTDDDFLPSEVTDQKPSDEQENENMEDPDNRREILFNQLDEIIKETSVSSDSRAQPYPKPSISSMLDSLVDTDLGEPTSSLMVVAIKTPAEHHNPSHLGRRPRRRLKSVLLTSTPHKEKLENEAKTKCMQAAEKEKLSMIRK